ncbi:MAG: PGPGW domain-containing protein [Propionibacteriaceae bacterium]
MPAGVEDTESGDLPDSPLSPTRPRSRDGRGRRERQHHFHGDGCDPDDPDYDPSRHDHNILLDVKDDRWVWRRKIRADPRKLFFYRFGVGFAGLFFICLGLVTGPVPGPGGIPLVLLGLAIWSSEFEWAQRVMMWFKRRLKQFQGWNRLQQTGFWIAFFACCGLLGYCYMLVLGIPPWVPAFAENQLVRLPGLP